MRALGWKQIVLALSCFAFVAACLVLIRVMPWDVASGLVVGSMGTATGWTETLKEATPLLIAGLAVYIALRAGLFNIGAEGQLMMGALSATVVALNISGFFGIVLAVIAGVIGGALWAWPAGLIKAYRNGHEVITTIMLNNVAALLSAWIIAGPLKSRVGLTTSTERVSESVWLPSLVSIDRFHFNLAVLLAVILIATAAWWMRRTVAGYELSAAGANSRAAATAGIDVKRTIVRAMLASGAISGLAGAFQVLAYEHAYYVGFSSGFGFDALGVALLAGNSPWGVLPSAFLFGVLAKGTTSVQTLHVPKGLGGIMIGVLIIVFAAYRYRRVRSHD